jgi:hypothetical protein
MRVRIPVCERACTRTGTNEERGVPGGGGSTHTDAHVTGVSDDEMGEAVAQLKAMGFAEAEAREVIALFICFLLFIPFLHFIHG